MKNQNSLPIQTQEDEIDLFELVASLWYRKWVIVGVTSIVIVLAIVYLVITPNVYEAKVIISETQPVNVTQLNVGEEQLGQYSQSVTSSSAFTLFQKNLQSRSLAMVYFKDHVEPVYRRNGSNASANGLLDNIFLKSISITNPGKKSIYLSVAHRYRDPALAAEWLNGYLRYIEQKTKEELIESAEHNKTLAVKEYEKEIKSLRTVYSHRLQDKIILLEEAYNIAKKLNLQSPVVSNLSEKVLSSSLDESLLYMRGYEVLGAEIDSLKSRELLDPFVSDIRPIQEKISYLDSVEYKLSELDVVNVDAWASEPERSIKPKKALVLVLAGLLGGMLGIFVSLILWVISKRKRIKNKCDDN